MASLVNALRSFHKGALSREELFARVDEILQDGRADQAILLETLNEENTKVPLPEDVHAQVQSRIEHASQEPVAGAPGKAPPDESEEDNSRTRLATSLFSHAGSAPDSDVARDWAPGEEAGAPEAGNGSAPEPMKGTGDVLNGRFVLEERIGTGGMSSVYKALDRRKLEANDRNPYVAVKVLNVEFRAHPDSLIALQREAKKSQSLAHPNIVRVYDFDRDGSTVYMTMEYLPGRSLAKVLRAPGFKGLPDDESMRILCSIAEALRFAHDSGIVHADFKPANVILTDQGQVKVIDFGIARAFQKPEDTDMEATRFDPGSLGALTPTYASCEMLEHKEPDPRDDIYALACIAYEMFTGRHPFGRMQATEARDGGLQAERRNLTRRQFRALKAALAFDRDQRTPDVEQFLEDLGASSVAEAISKGKKVRKPVSRIPLYTAAGVVLTAVAGFFIYQQFDDASGSAGRTGGDMPGPVVTTSPTNRKAPSADSPSVKTTGVPDKPGGNQAPAASPPVVKAPPVVLSEKAVSDALKDIRCSVMHSTVKDGVIALSGFVSVKFDVAALEKKLHALPGARAVNSQFTRVEETKCGVLDVLGPYWVKNNPGGRGTSISTQKKNNVFTEGSPLVVQVTTPAYESYVNVDYFFLDGGVVHMIPSPRKRANQAPPNYKAVIGDLGEWTIAGPFGREMVTVLLTPVPLFERMRKEFESGKEYLAALEKRLENIARVSGRQHIATDFVMIETRAR